MDISNSTAEPQIKPTTKRLSLIIGMVFGIVIASGFGVYFFWPSQVSVPDLRGKTLNDALTRLQASHLAVGRRTTQGDPSRANVVVSQFPSPGTSLATGSTVNLVLTQASPVPLLIGKSLYEAQRTLAQAGLQLGRIQWTSGSRAAHNTVLLQAPAAGQNILSGSTVNLTVAGAAQQNAPPNPRSLPQSAPGRATSAHGQNANIGGAWRDAGGAVVRIQQNGNSLQYTAHSAVGNCQGSGTVSGTNFETSYSCASLVMGARSSGRCAGTVSSRGNTFRLQCLDSLMGRTNDMFTR